MKPLPTLALLFNLISVLGIAQTPQLSNSELIIKFRNNQLNDFQSFKHKTKFGISSVDKLNSTYNAQQITAIFPSNLFSKKSPFKPQHIYKIRFSNILNLDRIIKDYSADPSVEYVQPNYVHKLHYIPNDPLFDQQDALNIISAEQAWDIQLASPNVIVGVIDTGVDYNHEDLQEAIWINPGEDLNQNGIVDSTDFNQIDDDGNGFMDDIRGWDFTDAPAFPDGGDFMTPDNNPWDEHGHGTSVSGIIGATGNNQTGIAGLAYGCRIMALRAGTSLGLLEEDDVASAIVYAVENGARIINMSFGDVVASPLLRDVMQYAYQQNCILVASSGNSSTDEIHYPSGFSETVSVSASNENDQLAGFSNYGSSVDVAAPGVNILTTNRFNQYGSFSGTSASAPFVSALAALILSKVPELSNESVKGLIESTSDDLGAEGWDNFFASGRINALKALQSPYFSIAKIDYPEVDQGFAVNQFDIRGTATGTFLEAYSVDIGEGETPEAWAEIFRQQNRQIVSRVITPIDISGYADGLYTLNLIVHNKNGSTVEDKVRFFIDRTPPVISNIKQRPMLDAEIPAFLLEFETDDICNAAIFFRRRNSSAEFQRMELPFSTQTHRILFNQEIFNGELGFFIEAQNGSGLISRTPEGDNLLTADLSGVAIGGLPVEETVIAFQPGFMLNKIADFDKDGLFEIILNEYDQTLNFGALVILEKQGSQFDKLFSSELSTMIPRDWGDSDGDGKGEILAGRGSASFILEADSDTSLPTQIVWQADDSWASRFTDLDSDGLGEIILRKDKTFSVWEKSGDNSYAQIDSLPNPTPGENEVGIPHTEIGDFDGDGLPEILIGDSDGDVFIYEITGNNQYRFTWSDRMPLLDTIDYLSTGDYNGDGIADFVVGCHTDPELNIESAFDSRHWIYRLYQKQADDQYTTVWEQAFFGFQSPSDFDSGVTSGDVDNDGRPEILINVFPDFYLVDYDIDSNEYNVIWHHSPGRSNNNIVADFDSNGTNEFYINDGQIVKGYQLQTAFAGPLTPTAFKVRPVDKNVVEIVWQYPGSADEFRIYRGTAPNNLNFIASANNAPFFDNTFTENTNYWYRVTAIDSSLSPVESLPTAPLQVRTGEKPYLTVATYLPPNQVRLTFSEPMDESVKNQVNYTIKNIGTPGSAIVHKSGREIIITSTVDFVPGEYSVSVTDVTDLDGTPIDTLKNTATFTVTHTPTVPFLVMAELIGKNQLQLEFSEAMDLSSVTDISNYQIEPSVKILNARQSSENLNIVTLQIDPKSPIGPFGVEYFITVKSVKSAAGVPIRFGHGDTAALIFSSRNLANVFVYPNPYRANSGQSYVTIAGLTAKATVRILDISGRLLRTLTETDGNGGLQWDLRKENGEIVPSGIYIFYVTGEGKKATGKFAVVR